MSDGPVTPAATSQPSIPFFSPYSHRPSTTEQASYGVTGALAGLATLPIEFALASFRSSAIKPPPLSSFLRSHLPHGLYRPAIRFWAFDLARSRILYESSNAGVTLPTWVVGGLSGGIGGFMEVFIQHIIREKSLSKMPASAPLVEQSAKLFFCFGSYTFLASRWAEREKERLPPTPFWKCWMYDAAAGAFGSSVVWGVKEGFDGGQWYQDGKRGGGIGGARWLRTLGTTAGKGALVIGTVISVQVTSCRMLLDAMDE